ncbi:sugar ABC transporter substrate-binding protein [Streptomyces sp. Ru71]|uniref:extracellular solute-binding protein n=1 Tax=Streptomyces sp. Ru71 TaxID=2080746 RepID=UPI000CDD31F2|nr:extracellular solute-binding protein [Streptomyces sp. Ru71]POX56267.1 sugar ABC transporter substrate-binding protein [Streptomyces sp. Ru71]
MKRTSPGLTRRGFLDIAGATGLAAAATACGAGGSSSGGASGSLTVLCESGGHAELTKIAAAFEKQSGHSVTFVELPYDGLYNRLHSELSNGSVSFDLAAVDAIWLPAFADALLPLDDLFTADTKADLFPSLVEGAQVNGRFVGMPAWTNAEILFYRKDLFENAAEKSAFRRKYGYPLAPPSNWRQFQDVASFFTRGTKLYGTDVKGAVETEWLAHVLQAGSPGVVLDDSGKVIIDNAQHLAALKFYSDLDNRLKVSPPGAAQLDWAGAQNLFHQGRTAMMRFWAHAYPLIPKDSPVHGKVGVAPMIAGSAGIGAIPGPFYLSVPGAGRNNSLAKQFVRFAYDNNQLAIQSSLGLAARKSAYASYASRPGYEHFEALLTTLDGPVTRSRPVGPKWQQIVDTVLVPMLQKSLTGRADYAALLAQARQEVEKLVQ